MYRVQFDDFRERDNDLYSFKRVEGEALQLIPILRANWVIALRGLVTVTDFDDSGVVPFFVLPALGGGSTLRGYPDFRFTDRNRLLMNAELRWTPARFMDWPSSTTRGRSPRAARISTSRICRNPMASACASSASKATCCVLKSRTAASTPHA